MNGTTDFKRICPCCGQDLRATRWLGEAKALLDKMSSMCKLASSSIFRLTQENKELKIREMISRANIIRTGAEK